MAADNSTNTKNLNSKFSFAVALLAFLAINGLVAYNAHFEKKAISQASIESSEYEKRQQGPWPWWLSRSYLRREKAPDVVLFGSSQMASATFSADSYKSKTDLDCVLYRHNSTLEKEIEARTGNHPETFNLAMGGGMVSDALMMSRALLTEGKKPKLVVLGVNPRDFIDNDLPAASATDSFKFFTPYVSLSDVHKAAYPDFFAHMDWELDQYLPLKRIRLQMQKDLASEMTAFLPPENQAIASNLSDAPLNGRNEKKFLQTISGSIGDVKPKEWVVPHFICDAYIDNTKEYLHRYHNSNPALYATEKAFFTAFLKDMQEKHIAVLVVGMPSQDSNRALLPETFWSQFRGFISANCTQYGATFEDLTASDKFVRHDFLDTVHLNGYGGDKLFATIADKIAASPQIVAALKPAREGTQIARKEVPDADNNNAQASAPSGVWR
ncbi:MAG: hypothetical protein P4L53_15145 [Candidatus Obscuribacterales bacterium]|nr:hypothetical protein [Candidatus Obscuribacterales bacterium]